MLSTPRSHRPSKKLGWLYVIFGFAGVIDTTYLTVSHYSGEALVCGAVHGCDLVTTSKYSTVGPVPLALLGMLYYSIIFLSAAAYKETGRGAFSSIFVFLPFFGFFFSLWLVYLQIFVIEAICVYCMASALISTVLAVFSFFVVFRYNSPMRD